MRFRSSTNADQASARNTSFGPRGGFAVADGDEGEGGGGYFEAVAAAAVAIAGLAPSG